MDARAACAACLYKPDTRGRVYEMFIMFMMFMMFMFHIADQFFPFISWTRHPTWHSHEAGFIGILWSHHTCLLWEFKRKLFCIHRYNRAWLNAHWTMPDFLVEAPQPHVSSRVGRWLCGSRFWMPPCSWRFEQKCVNCKVINAFQKKKTFWLTSSTHCHFVTFSLRHFHEQ